MKRKLRVRRETIRGLSDFSRVRGGAINTAGPECGQQTVVDTCQCPYSGTGSCNGTDCCPQTRQASCGWC